MLIPLVIEHSGNGTLEKWLSATARSVHLHRIVMIMNYREYTIHQDRLSIAPCRRSRSARKGAILRDDRPMRKAYLIVHE